MPQRVAATAQGQHSAPPPPSSSNYCCHVVTIIENAIYGIYNSICAAVAWVIDSLFRQKAPEIPPLLQPPAPPPIQPNVNVVDERGYTPLLYLASSYQPEKEMRALVAAGADVNARAPNQQTALHILAEKPGAHNTGCISFLLHSKATVDPIDDLGQTPLRIAAEKAEKSMDNVSSLLNARANPNAADLKGLTPLHASVLAAQEDLTEFLIARGADVNAQAKEGATPCDYVKDANVKERQARLLALLRGSGGRYGNEVPAPPVPIAPEHVNRLDVQGFAKLHYACLKGGNRYIEDEVRDLLDARADPNLRTRNDGRTPLHFLAANGSPASPACIELLLQQNADVDPKDVHKRTPLHLAASQSQKLVHALLVGRADPNNVDKNGLSPLHHAVAAGQRQVVLELFEHGKNTDPNLVALYPPGTPLDYVTQSDQDEKSRFMAVTLKFWKGKLAGEL